MDEYFDRGSRGFIQGQHKLSISSGLFVKDYDEFVVVEGGYWTGGFHGDLFIQGGD